MQVEALTTLQRTYAGYIGDGRPITYLVVVCQGMDRNIRAGDSGKSIKAEDSSS